MDTQTHWQQVYRSKAADAVSWYSPHLKRSLALVAGLAPESTSAIMDVGGGESTLVDDLLAKGYRDLSVLDISQVAIDVTRQRLGASAHQVEWIVGDITQLELPAARYDLWHDRAVFHFLTTDAQRQAYVRQVLRAVRTGGYVIVATFGPDGPMQCSGLDTVRYDAAGLHTVFGQHFQLLDSSLETHQTPWGSAQQFLYCHCVRLA